MNKMFDEILFCDWEIESKDFERTDLFNLPELNKYKVVFFDPINFAVKNNFRRNFINL